MHRWAERTSMRTATRWSKVTRCRYVCAGHRPVRQGGDPRQHRIAGSAVSRDPGVHLARVLTIDLCRTWQLRQATGAQRRNRSPATQRGTSMALSCKRFRACSRACSASLMGIRSCSVRRYFPSVSWRAASALASAGVSVGSGWSYRSRFLRRPAVGKSQCRLGPCPGGQPA